MGRLHQLYHYDGTVEHLTRFDNLGDRVISEMYLNAGTLRRYVPGPDPDEVLVWYEGAGTANRRWLHADERGSTVAISDGTGNALAIGRYDEYGIPAPTNIGRFQYTGQARLAEIGLYHYKARAYSPTWGRFLQTDPVGYEGGNNLYAYVGDDPVNATDATGNGPEILACAFAGPAAPVCAAGDPIISGVVVLVGGAAIMSGPRPLSRSFPASDRSALQNDNGGPPLDDDDLPVAGPDLSDRIGARVNVLNRRHYQAAAREARGEDVARRPDGRPYDHINELRESLGGLRNNLASAQRLLNSGRLNAAQAGRLRAAVAR